MPLKPSNSTHVQLKWKGYFVVQPNDLLHVVGICMNCGSLAQRQVWKYHQSNQKPQLKGQKTQWPNGQLKRQKIVNNTLRWKLKKGKQLLHPLLASVVLILLNIRWYVKNKRRKNGIMTTINETYPWSPVTQYIP